MYSEEKLLQKKKEIEEAKTELSELKGQEKALMLQLKNDWSCSTLEAANKKVDKLDKVLNSLEEEINELTEELEESYGEE